MQTGWKQIWVTFTWSWDSSVVHLRCTTWLWIMFPQHTKISGWLNASCTNDTPRYMCGYLYSVPLYFAIDTKIVGWVMVIRSFMSFITDAPRGLYCGWGSYLLSCNCRGLGSSPGESMWVALGHGSVHVLWFFPLICILPVLHTHSFI